MSFGTENRTISDVFSRIAKYSVPRYQRAYVWDKVNWSELLNDIKFTVKYTNTEWSHFLGAIVLINRTEQNKMQPGHVFTGISEYDIIDGQQRLTTIYILLLCLYHRFSVIQTEESKNRAQYLRNTFLTSQNTNAQYELKIYNEDYQNDIDTLYQGVLDNSLPVENNKFYPAFSYFNNELERYDFDGLWLFCRKLLAINLVEIISTQEEEIYNIFEVLNARGKKLKQMELLKNHVMKYIQPRTMDIIDKAKLKWNVILEQSECLSDEDVLLVHFCKCYVKKKAENSDMVYKLIKEEVDLEDLSKFLEDLVEYSKAYASIVSDNENLDIEYFNIKRSQQVRSLLAAIEVVYKREIITAEERTISFHNLRNFFFLFHACANTSNKTEDTIAKASFDVYHAQSELDYKFIMSNVFLELSKYIPERSVDELLFTTPAMHYSNNNATYSKNNRLVKYILFCLYTPEQRDTILDQSRLTIEHLLNDDGSLRNSSIYNLTLTSGDINANELKNKQIAEKVKILEEKSSIVANRKLKTYLDEEGNYLEEQRKADLKEAAVHSVFQYKESPFGFTKEMVSDYFKMKQELHDDSELLNVLLEKGINIRIYLSHNPVMKDAYNRFKLICEVAN
jgi:uncharacterized protein with ParB-like and HNH nuclease domain